MEICPISILFPKIFPFYTLFNISVWFLQPILDCKLKCHRLQSWFAQQTHLFGQDISSINCCCKYIGLKKIKSKSNKCCSVWTGFLKFKNSHLKVNVWRVYTFWPRRIIDHLLLKVHWVKKDKVEVSVWTGFIKFQSSHWKVQQGVCTFAEQNFSMIEMACVLWLCFLHTWYLSFFLHKHNFWFNFSPHKSA